MTLVAVIYANVMFRAATPGDAARIWSSMTGFASGQTLAEEAFARGLAVVLAVAGALVFLMPNSQQIMGRFDPALNWREWRDVALPSSMELGSVAVGSCLRGRHALSRRRIHRTRANRFSVLQFLD